MRIGDFEHSSPVVLAPMAGVTDQPFRNLCRDLGTYWTVSEMLTSDKRLWDSRKSRQRLSFVNEAGPRWVQIAGGEASMLAEAAIAAENLGADIIDINMGCPAKKVCNRAAGSALLRDTHLVEEILGAVVSAVDVPVTVKIRLGWSLAEINAVEVAKIAENQGVQLVTVHGRSRACKFAGEVHYDRIAEVVNSVGIPVIANGDICSEVGAMDVVTKTGAAGVMIGRAAQGRPWLPGQISFCLETGLETGAAQKNPQLGEIKTILTTHVKELASFYGEVMGPRIARKHVGWYLSDPMNAHGEALRAFNRLDTLDEQLQAIEAIFEAEGGDTFIAA